MESQQKERRVVSSYEADEVGSLTSWGEASGRRSSAKRTIHGLLPTVAGLADTDTHILRAGNFRLFVIVASGDLILGANDDEARELSGKILV